MLRNGYRPCRPPRDELARQKRAFEDAGWTCSEWKERTREHGLCVISVLKLTRPGWSRRSVGLRHVSIELEAIGREWGDSSIDLVVAVCTGVGTVRSDTIFSRPRSRELNLVPEVDRLLTRVRLRVMSAFYDIDQLVEGLEPGGIS